VEAQSATDGSRTEQPSGQNNVDDDDAAKQAFRRGQIAAKEGRHAQAAKFFERVLTIKQDNSMAHYGAALAYAELGNKARAEHHFSWFLLFAPPDDGERVRDAKAWLAQFAGHS
jgi:Flp pilus assembly protein TadD